MQKTKKRFNAYVDGFNLYKGVLEKRPQDKWLDLISFCSALRPDMELQNVFYFTARVKERFSGDNSPRRQHSYLRVLENQGIQVIKGQFRKGEDWMRIASSERTLIIQPEMPSHFGLTQKAINTSTRLASPDDPKAFVYKMEEKGSDVNLASYLLRDVYLGSIEAALVITGDSDLATPIKFAVSAGVNVKVLVPNKEQDVAELRSVATHIQELHPTMLANHQLPNSFITRKGGNIVKPSNWT